jgi:hypothetical protein
VEELIYRRASENLIPAATTKTLSELVSERLRGAVRLRCLGLNTIKVVKATSSPLKMVVIESPRVSGHLAVYRGAYLVMRGSKLTFSATISYRGLKPEVAVVGFEADGVRDSERVLLLPRSRRGVSVDTSPSSPKYCTFTVTVRPRYERPSKFLRDYVRLSNTLSVKYPIGVLDDSPKPASEYPVSGADNAVLDVPYSWSTGADPYPQPVLEGLIFTNMTVSLKSGFLVYGGKAFKDPSTNNTVTLQATVTNNSAYSLTAKHRWLVVAVLYGDNQHVSMASASVPATSFSLPRGASYTYSLDVSLPGWSYGRVALAHAMDFYDHLGVLRYTGGPFVRFEVGRVLLP